jgi:hypothetical protein
LWHPEIVPVCKKGEEEGWLYLMMRYMYGGALKEPLE